MKSTCRIEIADWKKITDRMKKLLAKLKSCLQNGKESIQCKIKERKQLYYFCRNKLMAEYWRQEIEEKKSVITFYSNASLAAAPKSDECQYCSKDATTPELPALLYQHGVRTNFEVIVLYTQVKVMVFPIVTVQLATTTVSS